MMSKFDRCGRHLALSLWLGLVGSLTVGMVWAQTAPEHRQPSRRKPNILLILAEGVGYGDLGCYGQSLIKTPNLDQLAAEGVRFTNFYAGGCVEAASQCALLTGQHTGHASVRGNGGLGLPVDAPSLAQLLKDGGYRTGWIGQWGLGLENSSGLPQSHGFDEFAGYLDPSQPAYPDHLYRYDGSSGKSGQEVLLENQAGQQGRYAEDVFTSAAQNFIRIRKPDRANHYRPFFLCLAYSLPRVNGVADNPLEVPSDSLYSEQAWPAAEKKKAVLLTRLDADVGKLLAQLKDEKLADNTVVLFCSATGPYKGGGLKFFQSSGPWRGHQGNLYEGGLRVPLLVRWPLGTKGGRVTGQLAAQWDLLPTLAEIAGAKIPDHLDGLSMLPALLGRSQTNQHAFLYWECHEHGFQQAVRMAQWKALRPQAGEALELYNLQSDPAEKTNVAAKNPDVVAKMEDCLKTARTDSPQWKIRSADPSEAAAEQKD